MGLCIGSEGCRASAPPVRQPDGPGHRGPGGAWRPLPAVGARLHLDGCRTAAGSTPRTRPSTGTPPPAAAARSRCAASADPRSQEQGAAPFVVAADVGAAEPGYRFATAHGMPRSIE